MDSNITFPTADVVKKTVSGLTLMTIFTLLWTGIAFYGLSSSAYLWLLGIFPLACMFFIYYAFQLRKAAQLLPPLPSNTNQDEEKKRGKWFGIICAAEGVGIFIAINIVINLHHPELQVPAMALVVGLHFFPLAKVFKRKMDYYLGTWSTLVALSAIVLTLNKTFDQTAMLSFTGVGLSIATTFYGINMILNTWKVKA
jgi:hypothetical protein